MIKPEDSAEQLPLVTDDVEIEVIKDGSNGDDERSGAVGDFFVHCPECRSLINYGQSPQCPQCGWERSVN